MDRVRLDKVQRQIKKLPHFVVLRLLEWVKKVERFGIRETRKIPGLHDEPLKGQRRGQRSIRLSKGWRAIYSENKDGSINIITVEEVTKHGY